jgi:hypothetical protein
MGAIAMSEDGLQARGRSMEEAFFARENERLRVGLQASARPAAIASFDLDEAIRDHTLRDGLRAHHVAAGTAAAMTLVPLVAVAWADRDLHDRERAAVLQAAEAAGIAKNSASHALLESWLHERPDPELFERWKSFIVELCADMDVAEVEALRAELLGRARAVAQSGGGVLGFGRVSMREQEVLEELEHAFPA